ncbi:MAG: OBG GTPase family GTP-binding protein [Methanoculleaceae archaeon]
MTGIEEEIRAIEEEIRNTRYNKATARHIGRLKSKLARLKNEAVSRVIASGGGGAGYAVRKSGDGTVVLVGFPSVGKSTLLNRLTGARSEIAPYAFTTVSVVPGVMEHRGAKIQILDIPGLIAGAAMGKGRGKEVISVVRSADLIIILADIYNAGHLDVLMREVEDAGIRINRAEPDITIRKRSRGGIRLNTVGECTIDIDEVRAILNEYRIVNADVLIRGAVTQDDLIDTILGNRRYIPAFIAINKVDLADDRTRRKLEADIRQRFGMSPIMISASTGLNIEGLRDAIFNHLGFIRVYLKPFRGPPDLNDPLIIRKPATVEDVCRKLHRDFVENFRYARVWGKSVKHDSQRVGLSHQLADGDILTVVTRG